MIVDFNDVSEITKRIRVGSVFTLTFSEKVLKFKIGAVSHFDYRTVFNIYPYNPNPFYQFNNTNFPLQQLYQIVRNNDKVVYLIQLEPYGPNTQYQVLDTSGTPFFTYNNNPDPNSTIVNAEEIKNYLFAVYLAYYPTINVYVRATTFTPPPAVVTTVLKFKMWEIALEKAEEEVTPEFNVYVTAPVIQVNKIISKMVT